MPKVQHFGVVYASIFDAMDLRDRRSGYVVTGMAPAANAAGTLVVSVGVGTYVVDSAVSTTAYGGGTIALTAADPNNPRVDVVYFSTGRVLSKSDGVATSVNPVPVSWPASVSPIALCFVPAGAVDFTAGGYVGDLRMFTPAQGGTPSVALASVAAAGGAQTYVRTDDTIVAFDANFPADVPLGGTSVGSSGTASFAARSNHGHSQTFIGCRVFHNVNQSVVSVGSTVLQFNSERYDTDPASMHSTAASTTKIKFRTPGKYEVGFSGECPGISGTGEMTAQLRINGATVIGAQSFTMGGTTFVLQVGTVYAFVSTDYVETVILSGAASATSINSTGNYSPEFWANKVG